MSEAFKLKTPIGTKRYPAGYMLVTHAAKSYGLEAVAPAIFDKTFFRVAERRGVDA